MGTLIQRGEKLGVYPLRLIRDVLKAFEKHPHDDEGVSELKGVDLPPCAVTAIRSELLDRGFFLEGPGTWGEETFFGPPGIALISAKARRKVPAAKAQGVLDEFLARCAENNRNPERFHDVVRVWLFGSLAKGAAEVGDVDIVVDLDRTRNAFTDGFRALSFRKRTAYARRYLSDSTLAGVQYEAAVLEKITKVRIYGPRRSSLLSVTSRQTLIDLHEPCRLVFCSESGGPLNGPLLEHHPESNGRAETINEPAVLPDLTMRRVPAPICLRGLGLPSIPHSEVFRGQGYGVSRDRALTVRGVRQCHGTLGDIALSPSFQTLTRPSRDDDLVLSRNGGSEGLAVAHIDQRWSFEDGIPVSMIDVDLVGDSDLSSDHLGMFTGHLFYLAAVSVHLAKAFTANDGVIIRLKAKTPHADRAVTGVTMGLTVDPAWALDGGEFRRLAAPRRPDLSLAAGVTIQIKTSTGSQQIDVDRSLKGRGTETGVVALER